METDDDYFSNRIFREAEETVEEEPELTSLLQLTVLAPGVKTFEDAVAATVCYRMLQCTKKTSNDSTVFCPNMLRTLIRNSFQSDMLECGHTMKDAVRKDAMAVLERDPACDTLLEVVLFYKGFSALVCHRAARQKWFSMKSNTKRSMTALFLQSQASAVFALDIHPAATIGAGILLDHGTGIVIGETATIGDGCTLLHGVTLGGTGKENGDRHPKIGKQVLIGAGSSILGNITVGNRAKIGAGSIVLRPIPAGATAVGAPAKIIGRVLEEDPANTMDETIHNVGLFHKSASSVTLSTAKTAASTIISDSSIPGDSSITSSVDDFSDMNYDEENRAFCPFREYAKLSDQKAPPDSITFCLVSKELKGKGCNHEQVWSVFFAMDTRNVGYIRKEDVNPIEVQNILRECTELKEPEIQTILKNLEILV